MEAKGRTTYNEVADELVAEMSRIEAANKNGQYDEKNIRRRVYDAINVLMAMDIIQKEKKEILWKGFPKLSHNSLDKLKAERLAKIKEVEQKQLYLQVRRAGYCVDLVLPVCCLPVPCICPCCKWCLMWCQWSPGHRAVYLRGTWACRCVSHAGSRKRTSRFRHAANGMARGAATACAGYDRAAEGAEEAPGPQRGAQRSLRQRQHTAVPALHPRAGGPERQQRSKCRCNAAQLARLFLSTSCWRNRLGLYLGLVLMM